MSHLSYHPLIYTLWKIFCPPYKSAAACFKAVFFKVLVDLATIIYVKSVHIVWKYSLPMEVVMEVLAATVSQYTLPTHCQ